jgi:hypothetical protein
MSIRQSAGQMARRARRYHREFLEESRVTSDPSLRAVFVEVELVAQKEEVFARSNAPVSYRSRAEILRMFDGFTLVEPGLTAVTQWRGDPLDSNLDAAGQWWLGGVGRRE